MYYARWPQQTRSAVSCTVHTARPIKTEICSSNRKKQTKSGINSTEWNGDFCSAEWNTHEYRNALINMVDLIKRRNNNTQMLRAKRRNHWTKYVRRWRSAIYYTMWTICILCVSIYRMFETFLPVSRMHYSETRKTLLITMSTSDIYPLNAYDSRQMFFDKFKFQSCVFNSVCSMYFMQTLFFPWKFFTAHNAVLSVIRYEKHQIFYRDASFTLSNDKADVF